MASSVQRVEEAAASAGLKIEIRRMPVSTRTADDAARACGCAIGQIVKSLVFMGEGSGRLRLLLISGEHRVQPVRLQHQIGELLMRADPDLVREKTGFAIGGVAPIGHINPIECWFDNRLLDFELVWAAAGAPDAVFSVAPHQLKQVIDAKELQI